MKTKDIVDISLFTTLLAVCAWIYIPTTIPFTMQTFAVFLAVFVLGGRKSIIVIFIYLLLGLVGVPVFSGGTAGPGVIFGATGGYMLGWIALGLIVCMAECVLTKAAEKMQIVSILTGLFTCYLLGTFWFVNVYTGQSTDMGYHTAFSICVLPFIIPDLVKLALAYIVNKRIRQYIRNV